MTDDNEDNQRTKRGDPRITGKVYEIASAAAKDKDSKKDTKNKEN